MTAAPNLPAGWHVAPDADGDETLWFGDKPILRRYELGSQAYYPSGNWHYHDTVWSVLTAVLAPDEATVERLAEESHDAVVGGLSPWSGMREDSRDIARDHIRAVLAAMAATSDEAVTS